MKCYHHKTSVTHKKAVKFREKYKYRMKSNLVTCLVSLASQPYFSPCAHARAFARACAHGEKYGWLARLMSGYMSFHLYFCYLTPTTDVFFVKLLLRTAIIL